MAARDSSPAVTNGVVFVGSTTAERVRAGRSHRRLLWRRRSGKSSPAVANGVVYVGSVDGNGGGKRQHRSGLWGYSTSTCVTSSPAVVNGVVYFGSEDYNVYALNASTGARLWTYLTGGAFSPRLQWRMAWFMLARY